MPGKMFSPPGTVAVLMLMASSCVTDMVASPFVSFRSPFNYLPQDSWPGRLLPEILAGGAYTRKAARLGADELPFIGNVPSEKQALLKRLCKGRCNPPSPICATPSGSPHTTHEQTQTSEIGCNNGVPRTGALRSRSGFKRCDITHREDSYEEPAGDCCIRTCGKSMLGRKPSNSLHDEDRNPAHALPYAMDATRNTIGHTRNVDRLVVKVSKESWDEEEGEEEEQNPHDLEDCTPSATSQALSHLRSLPPIAERKQKLLSNKNVGQLKNEDDLVTSATSDSSSSVKPSLRTLQATYADVLLRFGPGWGRVGPWARAYDFRGFQPGAVTSFGEWFPITFPYR